jgi:hypothetical protein
MMLSSFSRERGFGQTKMIQISKKNEKHGRIDNALILARALTFTTRWAFKPAVLPSLYGADPGEQNFQSCKIGMH